MDIVVLGNYVWHPEDDCLARQHNQNHSINVAHGAARKGHDGRERFVVRYMHYVSAKALRTAARSLGVVPPELVGYIRGTSNDECGGRRHGVGCAW